MNVATHGPRDARMPPSGTGAATPRHRIGLLAFALLATQAGHAAADGDDALMQRPPWAGCGYCHTGSPAAGIPPVPVIDGQFPPYLEKQLADYRAGRRPDPGRMMQSALVLLDAQDDRVVARHFARRSYDLAAAAKEWGAGAALYWRGRTGVPACSGCHGGPYSQASLPRLFGQGKTYLITQLRDFRRGTRSNDAGRIMHRIAAELNPVEIEALADYLAPH